MFLEPAEWSSEADSSKKHGEAIWHVVFQIARTYWRSVAYRHSRASRIVASLLRRNFTHTCVIFLSTPCGHFFVLCSLKYFCQMCLPQISHKIFYEWSIGHRSNLAQSLPQSLLRSVDRVFDQFVINVSVKSLEQIFHKSSTNLSQNNLWEIVKTYLYKSLQNLFAHFQKNIAHSYISEKV